MPPAVLEPPAVRPSVEPTVSLTELARIEQKLDLILSRLAANHTDPFLQAGQAVSLEEAADYLKTSLDRIHRLTKVGLLAYVKSDEEQRIPLSDLVRYRREEEEQRKRSRSSPLSQMFKNLYDEGLYDSEEERAETAAQ